MNWRDVTPENVAVAQAAWELNQSILRARIAGATWKEISVKFGVAPERVRQRAKWAEAHRLSPVEKWCDPRRVIGGILSIKDWADPEEELASAGQALVAARKKALAATKAHNMAAARYDAALEAARAARRRA